MADPGAAIAAIVSGFRSLADDTVRFQIDVEPRDAELALRILARRGTAVAVAVLTDEAAIRADQAGAAPAGYLDTENWGPKAKALHTSGFFRSPDVWRATDSDEAFLAWIRKQLCMANSHVCEGVIEAAHVRKVSEGAGTGIKPPYCAVPLCHKHHAMQHNTGYSAVRADGIEGFMAARAHYVQTWCKESIKAQMQVASLRDLEPARLLAWAEKRGVERYLPKEYRA